MTRTRSPTFWLRCRLLLGPPRGQTDPVGPDSDLGAAFETLGAMTASPMPPVPTRTVVHLMRHGEVHNPTGVLYGRLDGYHLSDLGREMAELVTRHLETNDVVLVVASPLDRAQPRSVYQPGARGTQPARQNTHYAIIGDQINKQTLASTQERTK